MASHSIYDAGVRLRAMAMTYEKIKITCVACGAEHERIAWHTWHQNLCDTCITEWAREKAVVELDQAIDRAGDEAGVKRNRNVLREHLRIYNLWRTP